MVNRLPTGVLNSIDYLDRFWNDHLENLTPSVQAVLTGAMESEDPRFDILIMRDILRELVDNNSRHNTP